MPAIFQVTTPNLDTLLSHTLGKRLVFVVQQLGRSRLNVDVRVGEMSEARRAIWRRESWREEGRGRRLGEMAEVARNSMPAKRPNPIRCPVRDD